MGSHALSQNSEHPLPTGMYAGQDLRMPLASTGEIGTVTTHHVQTIH